MFACRTRGDNNNQSEWWGNWAADCFSSKPIFKSCICSQTHSTAELSENSLTGSYRTLLWSPYLAFSWAVPGEQRELDFLAYSTWEEAEASKVRLSPKAAKISFTDCVFPSHLNWMPVSCHSAVPLVEISYFKPSLAIKHWLENRRPWSGDILR